MQHGETSPLPFHPLTTSFSNDSTGNDDYPLSAHDARRMSDIVGQDKAHYSRTQHVGYQNQGSYKSPRQSEGTYGQQDPPLPGTFAHPPDIYKPNGSATHQDYHSESLRSPSGPPHPGAGYHSSHYPYHHGPIMAPALSTDASSYSNYPPYTVPYAVHVHAAPSFESHGSSMPYVGPGHVVTYSYGPHPNAYPQPFPGWAAPPQIQYVKDIKPSDVLCGRGGATNSHSGNRAFRLLVKQFQEQYLRAKKAEKPSVADKVVALVRERGGRFLRRWDTSEKGNILWVDIGDDRAREKTCQALREGAPEWRKKKRGASSDDDSRKTKRKDTDDFSNCSSQDRSQDTFREKGAREDESDRRKEHSDALESDSRDDSEGNRGVIASIEWKEPIVIRPCARLLKRPTTTEISLEELTPHEKELYLRDFLPPDPAIRQGSKRREIYARQYEPVCRDDDDDWMGDAGDNESWMAAV